MVQRLSPKEFKLEYQRRGWTGKDLAVHWGKHQVSLSKIVNDPERPAHWDDAVRGLSAPGSVNSTQATPGRLDQKNLCELMVVLLFVLTDEVAAKRIAAEMGFPSSRIQGLVSIAEHLFSALDFKKNA